MLELAETVKEVSFSFAFYKRQFLLTFWMLLVATAIYENGPLYNFSKKKEI